LVFDTNSSPQNLYARKSRAQHADHSYARQRSSKEFYIELLGL